MVFKNVNGAFLLGGQGVGDGHKIFVGVGVGAKGGGIQSGCHTS